jgi:transcriptional regulator with XRE-family HTH domain
MEALGSKLKKLRNTKQWTQEDIAYELSISLPAYSKIERGVTDITLSRLIQIAKLFGMSASELLSFGDKKPDKSCKELLDEKDKEIMKLQKRIIDLIDHPKKQK